MRSNSQSYFDLRYKWQIKKESKGIQEGILYTGAEKGKRINYPGRVGTVDLEGGAQKAIKTRVAKLKPMIPPQEGFKNLISTFLWMKSTVGARYKVQLLSIAYWSSIIFRTIASGYLKELT